MSFLSILQRWTRKSTQRLCDNKLAATRKCVLSLPVERDSTQVFTQSFDVKSLTFPMAKRMTYPCNGNKAREKLFAETRLSLRGRPWKGRKVKMSYRDPPASDLLALHALVFALSLPFGRLRVLPRRLLASALRRRVLARLFFPMFSIMLCVFRIAPTSNMEFQV